MSGHQYRMAFLTTASSMLMLASAHVRQLRNAPQVATSIVPALMRAAWCATPRMPQLGRFLADRVPGESYSHVSATAACAHWAIVSPTCANTPLILCSTSYPEAPIACSSTKTLTSPEGVGLQAGSRRSRPDPPASGHEPASRSKQRSGWAATERALTRALRAHSHSRSSGVRNAACAGLGASVRPM